MSLALLFFVIRITEFGGPAPFFHINKAEIPGGLVQGLSMLVSFTGGALLFAVTTMGELRMGLRAGRLTPLLSRFGLALSLMLGFFPRFFEIWENTTLAWRARGGSPWKIGRLILPVTERMLEAAFDTAEALEARGWN
jgi:energy-coupling factor transporter transmembrane protein EcfT